MLALLAWTGGISFSDTRRPRSQLTVLLAANRAGMDQLKVKDRILENISLSVKKVSRV